MGKQPDVKFWHRGISIAGWKGDKGWNFKLPTKTYKDKESGEYVEATSLIDWAENSEIVTMAAIMLLACEEIGKANEVAKVREVIRDAQNKDSEEETPF